MFSFCFVFSFFFQYFFYFLVFCFEMHVINSFWCAASPSRVGVKKYQNITSNKCWIRQAKGPARPDPTRPHSTLPGPASSRLPLPCLPPACNTFPKKFYSVSYNLAATVMLILVLGFVFVQLLFNWELYSYFILVRVSIPSPLPLWGEMLRQSGRSFKKQ